MRPALSLFAALPLFAFVPQATEDPAPPVSVASEEKPAPLYDEKAVGKDQIAAALARAKRENRRVLLHWGANWCGWCKVLAQLEKTDEHIAKELLYEYDVVKINIGKWNKHMDLAMKYGVDLTKTGVPFLTLLDADGKVVINQATEAFELPDKQNPGHDPEKVLAFLKANEAPHLDAQAVHDAALATAKKDQKRVFLHFGAPWCGWCHKLDDWLAKPEIAGVIAKDFVAVKIDTDRMVGGAEMLARVRNGPEAGTPWFAFLDQDGKVIADSNGPEGNVGFPAAPAEIAHFKSMLEKVCTRITKDEMDALAASLVPPPKPQPKTAEPAATGGDR